MWMSIAKRHTWKVLINYMLNTLYQKQLLQPIVGSFAQWLEYLGMPMMEFIHCVLSLFQKQSQKSTLELSRNVIPWQRFAWNVLNHRCSIIIVINMKHILKMCFG